MVKLELGEDLLAQVEALSGAPSEKAHSTSLKFDDKGTVHVMYRDGDDKLMQDTAIKTMEVNPNFNDELKADLRDYDSGLVKQSKRLNRLFILFILMLAIMMLMSIGIVVSLR